MPTFLVTSRMPKPLRARIEAALVADLRQRTLFPGRRGVRKVVRVLLAVGLSALVWVLVTTYRQSRREVEAQRSVTLAEFARLRASVDATRQARLTAILSALPPLAMAEAAPDVGDARALVELVERPLLYVRGDVRPFSNQDGALALARDSSIDALALCLVMPPANLKESTLLRAIGRAPPPGRIHALSEALLGLDFLSSNFADEVRTAEHMQQLQHLEARVRRPSLQGAVLALQAEVLLVVIDEAKQAGVVADFDGEASHHVRLVALEIASGQTLWRRRVHVDPSWISDKSRLAYSRALDSCKLAYELERGAPAGPP